MESFHYGNLAIAYDKEGANHYTKVTYPIRYGRFCEIKTPEYVFQFNLNGEIKSLWKYNPFTDGDIQKALGAWSQLRMNLRSLPDNGIPLKIRDFLSQIYRQDPNTLNLKSTKLHRIIGGPVSVLPPDTRHVDYDVIPLMITDGCLYNCKFCRIKSRQSFRPRSRDNVLDQIRQYQDFYGDNLGNYNAVFLGNHDALAAQPDLICMAATQAYEAFGFEKSRLKNPTLFLFGSVDFLLNAGNRLFDTLNQIQMYTYVNIGLESVDAATLSQINKPLESHKVEDAFQMMLEKPEEFGNLLDEFLLENRL